MTGLEREVNEKATILSTTEHSWKGWVKDQRNNGDHYKVNALVTANHQKTEMEQLLQSHQRGDMRQ